MKVRFLTLMAGPSGVRSPGEEADLPVDTATELVAGGFAVAIAGSIERAVLSAPETAQPAPAEETATASAPETAASRRPRKSRA